MSKCTKETCGFKKFSGTCMAPQGNMCPHNTAVIEQRKLNAVPSQLCAGCNYNEFANGRGCTYAMGLCVLQVAKTR